MRKVRKRRRPKPPRFPLRDILRRMRISQYAAAKRTGLSQSYISALCHGRKRPSWGLLMHVMTSLGCDLGDLAPKGGAA